MTHHEFREACLKLQLALPKDRPDLNMKLYEGLHNAIRASKLIESTTNKEEI